MGFFEDLIRNLITIEGELEDTVKLVDDTANDIVNWFENLLD